jgi:opacity protein-like surface antigen
MINLQKLAFLFILSFFGFAAQAQQTGNIITDILNLKSDTSKPAKVKPGEVFLSVSYGFPNLAQNFLTDDPIVGTISSLVLGAVGVNKNSSGFGPIYFDLEYGLKRNLGIGLNVSYVNFENLFNASNTSNVSGFLSGLGINTGSITNLFGSSNTASSKVSILSFLGNVKKHFDLASPKLDLYAMAGVGFSLYTEKTNLNTTAPLPISYAAAGGLRYFVSPNLAILGEVGYQSYKSLFNVGMTLKM